MGLETGTYINALVVANPLGADDRSTADDHIRLLKNTIKNTFPNLNGAMTATQTELNQLGGTTGGAVTKVGNHTMVGNLTAPTVNAALNGNAGTATALETARNFSISGGVTAPGVSFDGSGNLNLVATVGNNTHTHNGSTIDANSISGSELAAAAVVRSHLSVGAQSASGSVSASGRADLLLNAYSFFPMIHSTEVSDIDGESFIAVTGHITDGASADNPRLGLRQASNGSQANVSASYDVDHRYIAA